MKIEVKGVTKKYGDIAALEDLSFTLDGPKIYGLLGRNGAGKTTFMEILAGQNIASSGQIEIDGLNPFDNQHVTESICLIKESDNFKRDLKIKNILKIFSLFYPTRKNHPPYPLIQESNLKQNDTAKGTPTPTKSSTTRT